MWSSQVRQALLQPCISLFFISVSRSKTQKVELKLENKKNHILQTRHPKVAQVGMWTWLGGCKLWIFALIEWILMQTMQDDCAYDPGWLQNCNSVITGPAGIMLTSCQKVQDDNACGCELSAQWMHSM